MIFTPNVTIDNIPLPVDTTGQTINVGNFPASQPVTGPLTDAQLRATPVPVSGTVSVSSTGTGTATITNVSVTPVVTTLSANNVAKTKLILYNEAGTLFVKLGSGASAISYSYKLVANTSLEIEGYHGIVTGIKASGTSACLVTEVGI
jgi:hypothetical protein